MTPYTPITASTSATEANPASNMTLTLRGASDLSTRVAQRTT